MQGLHLLSGPLFLYEVEMPGTFSTAQLVPAGTRTTGSVGTVTLATAGWGALQAVCTIVTTSGTIASFGCWIEGTNDGDNWFPIPFDMVIQQRSGILTNFSILGGVSGSTTLGLAPIFLANIATAATGSACTVGYKYGNLPQTVRAAYIITSAAGGLNFMIDAMVTT